MESYLHYFILIPILGLILNAICPQKKEFLISRIALFTVALQFVSILTFTVIWLFNGHPIVNAKDFILYWMPEYQFFIDFYFDEVTAVYLFVGSFITFLITLYSRYYMHRENGYKRFFNTIMLFYLGYNLTVLSGNLETLLIGWEILGISSFLLIAFYQKRYLPVMNALKVFSIYRLGDLGIILAMWATHHFWNENITFLKLHNYELVHQHLEAHSIVGVFISIMILISAATKSAQLPFSSWLPRAMEGPTPSSAIFYGSLSVHMGVFLLLRTHPFWEHQLSVRILIGLLGLTTSIVASGIARVQSSVKSQISYASISQIGLIFIEVAAGFETLALFHFAGNAFLRTYQLLVSPSVVSYLIKEQFYNFIPRPLTFEDSLPKRIENSFYMLCLKEWKLDSLMYYIYWHPLKWAGRKLEFITYKSISYFFIPLYVLCMYFAYHKYLLPNEVKAYLPIVLSTIGLFMILKSFSERKKVVLSWICVIMNHFWVALAISFNADFNYEQIYIYLSGIVVAGTIGYFLIRYLKNKERFVNLSKFHGHAFKHPRLALAFFICCLGLTGFPITPTFIGEDLIYTHIHSNQIVLAFVISLAFIIDGLAVIRIYARVFLGPHANMHHEMAFKSA
jgi:NADH-quinone oxidoreductase subunit L